MDDKQKLLMKLPKVDEVLSDRHLFDLPQNVSRDIIVEAIREEISDARSHILDESNPNFIYEYDTLIQNIVKRIEKKNKSSLIKLVNATGVTLHTNLGRAVLSDSACQNVLKVASAYSTLEYNLNKGGRGSRFSHIEGLICKITGAEAAIAVNNNAAATMLCLSAMAEDKEVIVSRGELVEIGGSFRIPDIMSQSGAKLVEVGTTNKTKQTDYMNAITEETGAIMKVHTSNYQIVGFTADTSLKELVPLGKKFDLPVIYDMGSGLLLDLSEYGIKEPTVGDSLKMGVDVVLFSGDKLMGGPQAGIIAGNSKYINKMRNHPLARAFRVDKLTLAALEATFREYLNKDTVLKNIPTLRMLTEPVSIIRQRAENLNNKLAGLNYFKSEIVKITDKVGGGSVPMVELEGFAVKINTVIPAEKIERLLRRVDTPVIARIIKDAVHFDMRTVSDSEIDIIVNAVKRAEEELTY